MLRCLRRFANWLFPSLEQQARMQQRIWREVIRMSKALDDLTAAVELSTSVTQSAVALIEGLAVQIKELKDDPAALEALADRLTGQAQVLADAVSANTTPAPVPEVPPVTDTPDSQSGGMPVVVDDAPSA